MNMYNDFLNKIHSYGWLYTPNNQDVIMAFCNPKLSKTDNSFLTFISSYKTLSNKDNNVWFISLYDYEKKETNNPNEISWNEFEKESLEYAEDDEERNEIIEFWNNNLPFIISTKNGYSYLAIILDGENKGKIIYGTEPIYEDADIICNSFTEFLNKFLISIKEGECNSSLFEDFI